MFAGKAAICRIVIYTLSKEDAEAIMARREAKGITNANPAHEGQQYPMLIVRAWTDVSANGHVSLDGPDTYWVTSRLCVGVPTAGCWHWPERPPAEAAPVVAPA